MRKPRDYSAELKALDDRARALKSRKLVQLGSLVEATGADAFDIETLAGGLLARVELGDPARKEKLRERGAAFFQRRTRDVAREPRSGEAGVEADNSGAAAARSEPGAA